MLRPDAGQERENGKSFLFCYPHCFLGENTEPHAGPGGEALGWVMGQREGRELRTSTLIVVSV